MATRLMSVGFTTALISALKILGDIEMSGKPSIVAIITFILGAIVILMTREGCEDELQKENRKCTTTYHDASYPSFLNK